MQENILVTLKYFDLFDYPLSKGEIWKWLFFKGKAGRDEFNRSLRRLVEDEAVVESDGYYFLAGRNGIIKIRKERELISFRKLEKAQRVARLLGLVPGVRMIAVVSNLGYLNAERDADIDLFIVTERNRIWSSRFWCVVLMKLLNQRPSRRTIKNKICLSYFVTEDKLNLEVTKVSIPDMHLIYLLSCNLLIYDEGEVWEKYIEENSWIGEYLPNFKYGFDERKFRIKPRLLWLKKIIGVTFLGFEQTMYKNIQLKKMAPELRELMNRGDKKVIINDGMLKLHSNDKREDYNKKMLDDQIRINQK